MLSRLCGIALILFLSLQAFQRCFVCTDPAGTLRFIPITIQIFRRTVLYAFQFFQKRQDRIPALQLGAIVPKLPRLLLQNRLKTLDPFALPVQLLIHGAQKPFLYQFLLIAAFRKQLSQSGFSAVDPVDHTLPFGRIDPVFPQTIKALFCLCLLVHIIKIKILAAILAVFLKHLPAGSKAFQRTFPMLFFHHFQTVDIVDARLPVLRDKLQMFQRVGIFRILVLTHHHTGQHITGTMVKHPLHQHKRRL